VHAIFSDRSLEDHREIYEFVSRSSEASADRLIDELIMRSEELPSIRRQYAVVEDTNARAFAGETFALGPSSIANAMLTLTSFESFTVEETSTN
jgi:enterochelin esterase-like enzyme